MRVFLLLWLVLWGHCTSAQIAKAVQPTTPSFEFVKNQSQWDNDSLRYRVEIPGGFLFLYNQTFQYTFYDARQMAARHHGQAKVNAQAKQGASSLQAHTFFTRFLGANASIAVLEEDHSLLKRNYYLGKQPARWANNVPAYRTLTYQNLYDDTDLKIYSQREQLKYEFIVQPNGEPHQIKMAYEYASDLQLVDGNLEITTIFGKVVEKAPYSYQIINEKRVEVPTQFVLKGKVVSFHFPTGYDSQFPLVIDPALVFSTYSGMSSDNWGNTACFDDLGRLYAGATAFGVGFVSTTPGIYNITNSNARDSGFNPDIGVFRYNATGTVMEYATFIGGTDDEIPHSLIVDNNNHLLILGTTSSSNYPADNTFQGGTSNIQPIGGLTYGGGADIVLTKIEENGQLVRARFFGGTGDDGIKPPDANATEIHNYGDGLRGDILVNDANEIFVASTTRSTSISGFSGTLRGSFDGILFKLDPNFNLQWGRYLGGDGVDVALSVKRNSTGQIFVAGCTSSDNFPSTAGGFLASRQGSDDGFIARFSDAGTLEQSTYLGTNQADIIYFIDLNNDDEIYAFGTTLGNYPVFNTSFSDLGGKQFIHQLSDDLTTNLRSTRFGTNRTTPNLSPTAFLVETENNCGYVYIAGWGGNTAAGDPNIDATNVAGMFTTPDAFIATSGGNDFYLAVFDGNLDGPPLYATFFGEPDALAISNDHVDGGTCRFSKDGTIYQAVCASCGFGNDFPTFPSNVWAPTKSTEVNCNCAAFKFAFGLNANFNVLDPSQGFQIIPDGEDLCSPSVRLDYTAEGADGFEWQIYEGSNPTPIFTESATRDINFTFPNPGQYTITLVTNGNPPTCPTQQSRSQTLNVFFPNFNINPDQQICEGENASLQAGGAVTYEWSPAESLDDPTIANPTASPEQTTTYTVALTDANGCTDTRQTTVEVTPGIVADFTLLDPANGFTIIADGEQLCNATVRVRYEARNETTAEWTILDASMNPLPLTPAEQARREDFDFTFPASGQYTLQLRVTRPAIASCPTEDILTQTIEVAIPQFATGPDQVICPGFSAQLEASGATSYLWSPAATLSDPTIANPVATPSETTTYTVQMQDGDGCETLREVTVVIQASPDTPPTIALEKDCDGLYVLRGNVDTTLRAVQEYTFQWDFGDGTTATNFEVAHTYPENTGQTPVTYLVTLVITDTLGCTIDFEEEVTIPQSTDRLNNVITPYDEDGKNDFFDLFTDNNRLEIFNRWGKRIYQSDNYQNDWGKNIPVGVYFYVVTTPNGQECNGWVEVMK
ncbi:MAG: PKD domain-containing protein [Thermonemataceae bacterium]